MKNTCYSCKKYGVKWTLFLGERSFRLLPKHLSLETTDSNFNYYANEDNVVQRIPFEDDRLKFAPMC